MASLGLLKRRILRALVRDDVDDEELAAWVDSATARLNRELRVKETLRSAVLPLTGFTFDAPADLLHTTDVRLSPNGGPLIYCSPAELATIAARPAYGGQSPGYYTTHGNRFEIVPWAVSPSTLQVSLWYFGKIPALVDDADTNTVLEEFGDLYLQAALIYGHRFYLEYDNALIKDGLVQSEIARLNDNYQQAKYGDGPLVAPPGRKFGGRYS